MAVNPGHLQAWFLACRPKTLSVSLSPVLVGTAVAWHDSGRILWLPLLAAAFGAAFIQIGTNLFNDVGDFLRGTDTPGRLGPQRALGQGRATDVAEADEEDGGRHHLRPNSFSRSLSFSST